ncbi:MAG: CoA pyrophosphatase [Pseudomonadota bacterium]
MDFLRLPWIQRRLTEHQPVKLILPEPYKRAAVAVVFQFQDEKKTGCNILFIRRAEHPEDPWSGHMAFPGGRVEKSDENALAAVHRETFEEVGIDLGKRAQLLGRLDDLHAMARGQFIPLVITPFVFSLLADVDLQPNDEVQEAFWVSASSLLDPNISSTVPYEIAGKKYDLPCFLVDDRVIWGLTHRILGQLFVALEWGNEAAF